MKNTKTELNEESVKKCMKRKKKLCTKGKTEITLKEHPRRPDLPVPYYSPSGRSSPEMALSVDH